MLSESFIHHWRRCCVELQVAGEVPEGSARYRHPQANRQWLYLAVLTGQVSVSLPDRLVAVTAGEDCLIPSGIPWCFDSPAAGSLTAKVWFSLFPAPAQMNPLLPLGAPVAVPLAGSLPAWQRHWDALMGEVADWQPVDPLAACRADAILRALLLDHLQRGFRCLAYADAPFAADAPAWLQQAMSHLVRTAADHRWTVAGLAELAGVTPSSLARACRRHHGRSPQALMRQQRVVFGIHLLQSGAVASVGEAAHLLRYPSARQFWRQCVQETGRSPRAWQKRPVAVDDAMGEIG